MFFKNKRFDTTNSYYHYIARLKMFHNTETNSADDSGVMDVDTNETENTAENSNEIMEIEQPQNDSEPNTGNLSSAEHSENLLVTKKRGRNERENYKSYRPKLFCRL